MQEQIFLKNAQQIKKSLNLSTEKYLEIFGMTKQEAESSFYSKNFPLMKAMNFCEYFQLDIVSMFSPDFDVRAFARNYYGSSINLPERYTLDKNSRVASLLNYMNALEDYGFAWLSELIFRRLQLPRQIVYFPEMEISIKLLVDFLEIVEQFQINLKIMNSAGLNGINKLNTTFHFVDALTSYEDRENDEKKIKLFYEDFFHSTINIFDKTYNYSIEGFNNNLLLLKCTTKDYLRDLYQMSSLSSAAVLEYKSGIIAGVSTLVGSGAPDVIIKARERESGFDLFAVDLSRRQSFAGELCLH